MCDYYGDPNGPLVAALTFLLIFVLFKLLIRFIYKTTVFVNLDYYKNKNRTSNKVDVCWNFALQQR